MNNKSIHIETTKRTVVLIAIIAMTFMATLDSSIVNVALPVLSEKLNVTISAVEWVIASYSIIICSTILFWGALRRYLWKIKNISIWNNSFYRIVFVMWLK